MDDDVRREIDRQDREFKKGLDRYLTSTPDDDIDDDEYEEDEDYNDFEEDLDE